MKTRLLLICGTALLILTAVVVPGAMKRNQYSLQIKTYFRDAAGLKAGAAVELAGVKVGEVKGVRARPELKDHPAEVVINLRTDYPLSIPSDAVVTLASAGVLSDTFAVIDVANTSGAPLGNGAVLRSTPMQTLSAQEVLNHLSEVLKAKGCDTEAVTVNTSQHPSSPRKPK